MSVIFGRFNKKKSVEGQKALEKAMEQMAKQVDLNRLTKDQALRIGMFLGFFWTRDQAVKIADIYDEDHMISCLRRLGEEVIG